MMIIPMIMPEIRAVNELRSRPAEPEADVSGLRALIEEAK